MGLGCGGGCCHGLEAITACNKAACMSALGSTGCQQLTHRTIQLPWCPGRSCSGSQVEGRYQPSLSSQPCHGYCHLKHGRSEKQTLFLTDYLWPYQTERSAFTFLLCLSQWNITRPRPHILLSKPFLDSSHSNRGQTPSSAIVTYKLDLLNISGNSVWAHKPFPHIKSEWK